MVIDANIVADELHVSFPLGYFTLFHYDMFNSIVPTDPPCFHLYHLFDLGYVIVFNLIYLLVSPILNLSHCPRLAL